MCSGETAFISLNSSLCICWAYCIFSPPLLVSDVTKEFPSLSSEYCLYIVVINMLAWHFSHVKMHECISFLTCTEYCCSFSLFVFPPGKEGIVPEEGENMYPYTCLLCIQIHPSSIVSMFFFVFLQVSDLSNVNCSLIID